MPAALAIVLGGVDVTDKVDFPSLVMQLAGSQEIGSCNFDIVDEGLTVSATAESTLTVTEVGSATVLFGGFTRSPQTVLTSVGRIIHIKAYDYNSLLDRSIVVSDSRVAGESDHARLVYLMGIYGTQFSSDYTQIATLNGSLPAQKFIALTLRQAIERVLGQASYKSSYFVDATGRLHTYDRTVVTAAPFNIRIGTPGGGEIAPADWTHDRDTDNLANAIYVVGATAAGSGWFTDVTSISTYGRRERFFNAPDSDTHAKASQVGLAVLGDQKDPAPRAAFTTKSPADGWRIGQSITVNSVQDDLVNQSYRIAKVSTHYLNPAGDREYAIELGAPQVTLSALLGATHGGGGGFPWHSPGGAGWGSTGGVVGSGSTGTPVSGGGGCACNTPYTCVVTTFDNFNRTVSAGAGTASGGSVWSNVTTPGGTDYGVNGSQLFCGLSGGTFRIRTATGGFTTAGSTTFTTRFYFVQPAAVFANYEGFTMYLEGTGGLIGWSFTLNSPSFSIFTAGGTTQSYTYPAAWSTFDYSGSPIWFNVKWSADWSTGDISARIWLDTETEPTADQVTMPTSAAVGLTGTIRLNFQMSSAVASRAGYLDYITADPFGSCVPANSGQPYPRTNLGTGNNVQTAFSALTPFRAGSLQVWVDTTPVTPTSQTPGTGAFVLPFPPTSIESIWASWIAA